MRGTVRRRLADIDVNLTNDVCELINKNSMENVILGCIFTLTVIGDMKASLV